MVLEGLQLGDRATDKILQHIEDNLEVPPNVRKTKQTVV
jgi:hypothetical protein